jgi:NAD(P)-dependent dehydrogenase (short-subunit alcohol dehydrogenase family)
LAERRIRVNSIAPGFVDTEIWKKELGADGKKVLKKLEKTTLLKRSAKPQEIAHAAIFLCENDYIDGETIIVDGGKNISSE